jgi:hypothetical protein
MPLDQFTALGVAAGLFTAFVGVSHLWPLVTTPAPNNTMLHALTSWALLPLGLLLALRDGALRPASRGSGERGGAQQC